MDGEDDERTSREARPLVSVALRNSVVFLAVLAGGAMIEQLSAIITPLVIALFLLLLIDGFDRAMAKRLPSLPAWLRSTLGAALTVGGFSIVVGICAHSGRSFIEHLIVIAPKIDALMAQMAALTHAPPARLGDIVRIATSAASLSHVFGAARGFLSEAALVVIYLGFLLASRQVFGLKLRRMFSTASAQTHAQRVFERVRIASEQYVGLQTFKAVMAAATAYVIMTVMGLTDPLFLALLVFLAGYVPIVGGIAAAALPSLVAFGEFDGLFKPLLLLALLGGTIFAIESILLPKLQGDRLNLDPVIVLLSLGFWGAMLGVAGALLSTPLTVVVMAVAAEFEGSRWLAVLLSRDGELARPA